MFLILGQVEERSLAMPTKKDVTYAVKAADQLTQGVWLYMYLSSNIGSLLVNLLV